MANTNVTMRIDETLKAQLQELMSNLGLDMTTFFTMAAKQAVREQALPFKPDMNETPNIETLKATNESLIATFDEVMQIQQEGRQKRQQAEVQMQRIEAELKAKLLQVQG